MRSCADGTPSSRSSTNSSSSQVVNGPAPGPPIGGRFNLVARALTTTGGVSRHLYRFTSHERVLYPRNTRPLAKPPVNGGTPITEETCLALRVLVFGSSASPPKNEWLRSAFTLRPAGQALSFGVRSVRNSTRGFVTAVQALVLKQLLFKIPPAGGKADSTGNKCSSEVLLKPSQERQIQALSTALAEVLWRAAGGFPAQSSSCSASQQPNINVPRAVVVLPQEKPYLQHSVNYFRDGVTETLHLFEFTSLDDLEIFVKRYLYLFQDEGSPGAVLLLYSAILSRGLAKIRSDLEESKGSILSGCPEEGPMSVVMLALTGRASPHLHNGVIHVGDENTYAVPQWGVLTRSEVGLLVYEGEQQAQHQPGSRLKTPSMPIWVSLCLGHHGVLFNTNRELLRNYHAERRFDLQYYTCGGSHTNLTVDTRVRETSSESSSTEVIRAAVQEGLLDIAATPLEKLIHSKWQDALIQWGGTPALT